MERAQSETHAKDGENKDETTKEARLVGMNWQIGFFPIISNASCYI
jgi:hypothetical protein